MSPDRVLDVRRRRLVLGSIGVGAAAGICSRTAWPAVPKALPEYARFKDAANLITHSALTIETERGAFGTSVITADDILFVRNNLPPPQDAVADRDAWQIRFEGVRRPRTLALRELKRIGIATVPMVLQCSGNGRAFFSHKASGTQWRVGAAGCVIFSGVPLGAVVEALGGVVDDMKFLTGTGGEKLPAGVDPLSVVVERSVPVSVLDRALLAWELNGEPLPLAHGGPLRLVIPGYFGVNNVKYVKRLAFTPEESQAAIQRTGYRVRPIGHKGAPDQPSMWDMSVKSFIIAPMSSDEPLTGGRLQIVGVAFGGERAVRSVNVSPDGGRSWQPAALFGPDLGPFAWRQFVLPMRLPPGTHMLASRATDVAGNVQPADRLENERGYGHTGWRDHAVAITVR